MMIRRTTRGIALAALCLAGGPPALGAQQAPAAAQVLRRAAENFKTLRALYFTLATHNTPLGLRIAAVSGGDGTVLGRDRMVFRGSMQRTPAMAAPFVTVACGSDQYIEMGDGEFQKMEGAPNLGQLLFASDTSFLLSLLTRLENVSKPQAAMVDKVAVWHVMGTVPGQLLAALPGRPQSAGAGGSSAAPLRAELWIGKQDQQLRQVTFSGSMFAGDSGQATRTLTLSRFNEALPLTVPRGHLPCDDKR